MVVADSRRRVQQKRVKDHAGHFLTNHAHVLTVLDSEPNLTLREVALRVGITERAVQRIVVDLEQSGFLEREKGWATEPISGSQAPAPAPSDRGTSEHR